MNARMLIPSKYFSASEFEGEMIVTIESVHFIDLEVEGKNGKPATTETRGSIMLKESSKPWVCNVTNTKCLIAMFGEEDVERRWVGKRVTVFAERVMSFGEWVLGVRIKGSPDLEKPVSLQLKLRKKRTQVLTMIPTGARPASNGNGNSAPKAPPAPITTVTFGEKQGWKGKPIASFDSATLNTIVEEGKLWVHQNPRESWVPGVNACIAAIEANLLTRVAPPLDQSPPAQADAPPPF